MSESNDSVAFAALLKENRILKKKLARSEADRTKLEETKRNKESLLKQVIVELQDSQVVLERKSSDLEQAFNELTLMQSKLVESEKMSALGSLVAGVAHEINTPVGTSITLASTLEDETKLLLAALAQGPLTRSLFNNYLDIAQECASLLLRNLVRAGELVQSFKQMAVDQVSLEQRTVHVKQYLEEVVTTLSPHLKKTHHTLTVEGDGTLSINSYPGAIAQIVTNLVTNSLTHAFRPTDQGHLWFEVVQCDHTLLIRYSDDGCGITAETLPKIFDPFFTTARHQGGTGLGLHIVYNLVTQKLRGSIHVQSAVGQGTQFQIMLPLSVASAA